MTAQTPAWQWARGDAGVAGANGLDNYGESVCTDANGNVFATGYFSDSIITFGGISIANTGRSGSIDFFIVKYDSSGNVLWAKGASNATGSINEGTAVSADAGGNVFVTGYFSSDSITFGATTLINAGGGYNDIFVVKYDSMGNVLWAKSVGGDASDGANSIATDGNGNVYVGGWFESDSIIIGAYTLYNYAAGGAGYGNLFIAKYDPVGNLRWVHTATGGSTNEIYGITYSPSGCIYATGSYKGEPANLGGYAVTYTDSPYVNIFTVKYDTSGGVAQWAQSANALCDAQPSGITADATGNVYVIGGFDCDSIIFGNITLSTLGGAYNIFMVKYAPSGSLSWVKVIGGGSGLDQALGITADVNGYIDVTGYFQNDSIVFGNITLHKVGNDDIFVVKLDPNGNAVWGASVGSAGGTNIGKGIATDANGRVHITGYYGSRSLVFGTDTLINTSNDYDYYIAKLESNILSGISNIPTGSDNITVYPNPTTGTLFFKGIESGSKVEVYDVLGQLINSSKATGDNYSINLSGNSKDVYFYRITNNSDSVGQGKVVVE